MLKFCHSSNKLIRIFSRESHSSNAILGGMLFPHSNKLQKFNLLHQSLCFSSIPKKYFNIKKPNSSNASPTGDWEVLSPNKVFIRFVEDKKFDENFVNDYMDEIDARYKFEFCSKSAKNFQNSIYSRIICSLSQRAKKGEYSGEDTIILKVLNERSDWIKKWCEVFISNISIFDPRNLSSVICAIADLQIDTVKCLGKTKSLEFWSIFLRASLEKIPQFNAQDCSSMIYAMGILHTNGGGETIPVNKLCPTWFHSFLKASKLTFTKANSQDFSTIIYGFSQLKVDPDSIAKGYMTSFLRENMRAMSESKKFDDQACSVTIYSLAKLHIDCEVVCPGWMKKFLKITQSNMREFRSQGLSNTFYALGRLNIQPDELCPNWMRSFFGAVAIQQKSFSLQSLSNIILTLGSLNINPNNIYSGFYGSFLKALQEKLPYFKPQGLSNTIFALAQLRFNPDLKCENWILNFLKASQPSLNHFSPQGLSNTIFALSQLKIKPDDILPGWIASFLAASEDKLQSFNPQELNNTLMSLQHATSTAASALPASWISAFFKASLSKLKHFEAIDFANTISSLKPENITSTVGSEIIMSDEFSQWIDVFVKESQGQFKNFTGEEYVHVITAFALLEVCPSTAWMQAFFVSTELTLSGYKSYLLSQLMAGLSRIHSHKGGAMGMGEISSVWMTAYLDAIALKIDEIKPNHLVSIICSLQSLGVTPSSEWLKTVSSKVLEYSTSGVTRLNHKHKHVFLLFHDTLLLKNPDDIFLDGILLEKWRLELTSPDTSIESINIANTDIDIMDDGINIDDASNNIPPEKLI